MKEKNVEGRTEVVREPRPDTGRLPEPQATAVGLAASKRSERSVTPAVLLVQESPKFVGTQPLGDNNRNVLGGRSIQQQADTRVDVFTVLDTGEPSRVGKS